MKRDIPWWSPQMGGAEYALVQQVLDSNYLNEGDVTALFEQRLAELIGVRHVVTVTSGTAALFLALVGVGVGRGDEVIVPDLTFIATANAVLMAGARPVLVDVDPLTLNIETGAIARAITKKTKAVMPVHVSGRAANLPAIMEIAARHGIDVIEDAAEAFMSRVGGKFLGTFGKAGCLSFSPHKIVTTGQGGAILTDDDELWVRLRQLKDQGRPLRGTGGDDRHPLVGYNFKFTNLQAAVGLGQLGYLEARLERMKQIYRGYVDGLRGLDGISLLGFRVEEGESPLWIDALVARRDELDRFLVARGIHCRRFWFPIHRQPPYHLPDTYFPHSTKLSAHALWLPSSFIMSDTELTSVCQLVQEFFHAG